MGEGQAFAERLLGGLSQPEGVGAQGDALFMSARTVQVTLYGHIVHN